MDFVEDVTPHQLRHAAIPNETVDYWERVDLLALGELTSFVRHSASYGMTLTKMTNRCAGQSKKNMSEAYNRLIEHRFLVRIEFTYARPSGSTGRSGQRYTKHAVSRVPISEEQFAELVKAHAPGKYVLIPYGDEGEKRRVKVLAAEMYSHHGPGRITSETQLMPHENSRGGKSKRHRQAAADKTSETSEEPPSEDASPESTHVTSGATSENAEDPQVAPEVNPPESGGVDSITKYGGRTTDTDQGAARALPPVGCDPDAAASGHDRTENPDAPDTDNHTTHAPHAGDQQTARASHTPHTTEPATDNDTLTREQAQHAIRQALAGTSDRSRSGANSHTEPRLSGAESA